MDPFHPLTANPRKMMGTVAACAFGILGTMGPSKGPGIMLSIRNIERATATYPIFAIAIYYRYRSLIIPSALSRRKGPFAALLSFLPERLGENARHLDEMKRGFQFS